MTIRASEFYRRMKELDEIREDGIEVLKDKGIILPGDSSFREIVNGIRDIESVKEEEEKEEILPDEPEEGNCLVYFSTNRKGTFGICDDNGNIESKIDISIPDGEKYEIGHLEIPKNEEKNIFSIFSNEHYLDVGGNINDLFPNGTFGITITEEGLASGHLPFLKEGTFYRTSDEFSTTTSYPEFKANFKLFAEKENNLNISLHFLSENGFSISGSHYLKILLDETQIFYLDDTQFLDYTKEGKSLKLENGSLTEGEHTLSISLKDYRSTGNNSEKQKVVFSIFENTKEILLRKKIFKSSEEILVEFNIPTKIDSFIKIFFQKYKTLKFIFEPGKEIGTGGFFYLGEHDGYPLFFKTQSESGVNTNTTNFLSSDLRKKVLPAGSESYKMIENPKSYNGEVLVYDSTDNKFNQVVLPDDFSEGRLYFIPEVTTAEGSFLSSIKSFLNGEELCDNIIPYAILNNKDLSFLPGRPENHVEKSGKVISINEKIWPIGLFEISPFNETDFCEEILHIDDQDDCQNLLFYPLRNHEKTLDPFKNNIDLFKKFLRNNVTRNTTPFMTSYTITRTLLVPFSNFGYVSQHSTLKQCFITASGTAYHNSGDRPRLTLAFRIKL